LSSRPSARRELQQWAPCRRLHCTAGSKEVAGTSQNSIQVGRRKPVIQGRPAGKILRGPRGAGFGRLEPTNGPGSPPETRPSQLHGGEIFERAGKDGLWPVRTAHQRQLPGCSACADFNLEGHRVRELPKEDSHSEHGFGRPEVCFDLSGFEREPSPRLAL
jgi:hypothetical protein